MMNLKDLYAREIDLGRLLMSEPEGTKYHEDLSLSLARVRAQINNLEFSRTNPLVMVNDQTASK